MKIYTRKQVELVRVQFFNVVNNRPISVGVPSIALEDSSVSCKENHDTVHSYVYHCFVQFIIKPRKLKNSIRTKIDIRREEFGKSSSSKNVSRKGLSKQITVYNLSSQQCHDMFMKYLNKKL